MCVKNCSAMFSQRWTGTQKLNKRKQKAIIGGKTVWLLQLSSLKSIEPLCTNIWCNNNCGSILFVSTSGSGKIYYLFASGFKMKWLNRLNWIRKLCQTCWQLSKWNKRWLVLQRFPWTNKSKVQHLFLACLFWGPLNLRIFFCLWRRLFLRHNF